MKKLLLIGFLGIFPAASSAAGLICPPAPRDLASVGRDVNAEINGKIEGLKGLASGAVGAKAQVTAKGIFEKYPNVDRLIATQMMSSVYCSMLNSSAINDVEKLNRWESFQNGVLNIKTERPSASAPQTINKSSVTNTDNKRYDNSTSFNSLGSQYNNSTIFNSYGNAPANDKTIPLTISSTPGWTVRGFLSGYIKPKSNQIEISVESLTFTTPVDKTEIVGVRLGIAKYDSTEANRDWHGLVWSSSVPIGKILRKGETVSVSPFNVFLPTPSDITGGLSSCWIMMKI
jgi:hypothetical protein